MRNGRMVQRMSHHHCRKDQTMPRRNSMLGALTVAIAWVILYTVLLVAALYGTRGL